MSVSVTLTAFSVSAFGHHGQDFLLLHDYSTPSPLNATLASGLEWEREGSADGWSTESNLMLGVAPRLSIGAAVNFADEGRGMNYDSVMPYVHFQLTPPEKKWPVRVAIMAGYMFGESQDPEPVKIRVTRVIPGKKTATKRTITTTTTDSNGSGNGGNTGGGDPPPDQCGPDYGPDAPPCPDVVMYHVNHVGHGDPTPSPTTVVTTTSGGKSGGSTPSRTVAETVYVMPEEHHHTGIHQHGVNAFMARLILEADLTEQDKFVFNLVNVIPENSKPAWGYGAGLRHAFSHQWAVGVEATGDFGDANEHELDIAGFFSPNHSMTFKLGVGLGLTDETPDVTLRTGFMVRF